MQGLFTDSDSMESAIVVNVTGVSDPDAFSAVVENGNIVVMPVNLNGLQSGTINLKANSNGQLASMTLTVRFPSSGIDQIESEDAQTTYYTLDGQKLSSRPSTPGIYILRTPSSTSKIIVR